MTEQKPKHVTERINSLLLSKILEQIDKASAFELMCILQGFRKRKSKEIYMRVRTNLLERKDKLFPKEDKNLSENLINFLFTLASNRPTNFGTYRLYQEEQLTELLTYYEDELKEAIQTANPETLTRAAQTLYLLKTT